MSSINYYAKYLKYKKKYLDLVNEINYGGADEKKLEEAKKKLEKGEPLTKEQQKLIDNNKQKTTKVEVGSNCSEIEYIYCPEGQYCHQGHCKEQTVDQRKDTKTFINNSKEMIINQNMSEKQKLAKAAKAQKQTIKEAENEKKGQTGGEDELNINELLSESSFN
tara:strand:- start:1873 stop:2364 length:492 start_codon:yes stop_codon:yes gene_type:complete